jgi:hypothetical protein
MVHFSVVIERPSLLSLKWVSEYSDRIKYFDSYLYQKYRYPESESINNSDKAVSRYLFICVYFLMMTINTYPFLNRENILSMILDYSFKAWENTSLSFHSGEITSKYNILFCQSSSRFI